MAQWVTMLEAQSRWPEFNPQNRGGWLLKAVPWLSHVPVVHMHLYSHHILHTSKSVNVKKIHENQPTYLRSLHVKDFHCFCYFLSWKYSIPLIASKVRSWGRSKKHKDGHFQVGQGTLQFGVTCIILNRNTSRNVSQAKN